MGPEQFQAAFGVSDEVLARLQIYVDLLAKWQAKINLVGPKTLADVWQRHIADSAQLLVPLNEITPPARPGVLVDLGTGAGFPGLVLAILTDRADWDVHLVESDGRKCAFLREVNRATGAGATIHNARIESLDSLNADVVVARALAPLTQLLTWAAPHLRQSNPSEGETGGKTVGKAGGKCLFLKGKRWQEELTDAQKAWKMQAHPTPSLWESGAVVLRLDF